MNKPIDNLMLFNFPGLKKTTLCVKVSVCHDASCMPIT